MSRIFILVAAHIILSSCAQPMKVSAEPAYRILFVGNSLTYYNDLPNIVNAIAENQSQTINIRVEMLAEGGASLAHHIRAGVFERELAQSKYDFVVLQDIGGWPLCPQTIVECRMFEKTLSEAVNIVRAAGAEPIWYSTWQLIPGAQEALSTVAITLSRGLNVAMVDIGGAIAAYRGLGGAGEPLTPDGHPTPVGTWLAATAIVAVVSGGELEVPDKPINVCSTPWQGSELTLDSLSSSQSMPTTVCNEIPTEELRIVVRAANQSLNLTPTICHASCIRNSRARYWAQVS